MYDRRSTLTTVGERRTLAITGAAGVGTPGAKTVEIRLFRLSGSGSAIAHGNSTATYYPFGSTGGNTLAAQSLPGGPTSVGD